MNYLEEARNVLDHADQMLKDVDIIADLSAVHSRLCAIEEMAETGIPENGPDKKTCLIACRDIAAAASKDLWDDVIFASTVFMELKKAHDCLKADKARKPTEKELQDIFREEQGQDCGKPPYKRMNA